MKQIVLLGDLTRWQSEADFIADMLHFTATRVLAINLGLRPAAADLNRSELRRLFPGNTLAESVSAAMAKLYRQGIVDGLLCLVSNEPNYYLAFDKAFAALPFGLPKVALISGDSPWRGSNDVLHAYLPGTGHNLNPIIKISLGNTAFAVSGMSLCNIHNFGSNRPTIATACCPKEAGKSLAEAGLNFISFNGGDDHLAALIRNGYIHGLLFGKEFEGLRSYLELAVAREIPVVIAGGNPAKIRPAVESISPKLSAPVAIITSAPSSPLFSTDPTASPPPHPAWLKHYSITHRYGTEHFYRFAAKTMVNLLS